MVIEKDRKDGMVDINHRDQLNQSLQSSFPLLQEKSSRASKMPRNSIVW